MPFRRLQVKIQSSTTSRAVVGVTRPRINIANSASARCLEDVTDGTACLSPPPSTRIPYARRPSPSLPSSR